MGYICTKKWNLGLKSGTISGDTDHTAAEASKRARKRAIDISYRQIKLRSQVQMMEGHIELLGQTCQQLQSEVKMMDVIMEEQPLMKMELSRELEYEHKIELLEQTNKRLQSQVTMMEEPLSSLLLRGRATVILQRFYFFNF
ncbi:uncharacterized protein LOC119980933 isoform X1 [Tripterygium wilfordii]|uniref:uncharacterized protein LOC119980933 isoform X1 n=1 Tax=Tripterygium wilfordii TaxID=458696 RepID=UPI0018F8318B|nr:uncharacterized protein LOC119980933 isoform X1 [Tripterygium wilfordii]XP_038679758.1 uncharacterized protein LOC119980933 isoform X1 [Tripterygium wilfordii]